MLNCGVLIAYERVRRGSFAVRVWTCKELSAIEKLLNSQDKKDDFVFGQALSFKEIRRFFLTMLLVN
jgi:hypothetical protein